MTRYWTSAWVAPVDRNGRILLMLYRKNLHDRVRLAAWGEKDSRFVQGYLMTVCGDLRVWSESSPGRLQALDMGKHFQWYTAAWSCWDFIIHEIIHVWLIARLVEIHAEIHSPQIMFWFQLIQQIIKYSIIHSNKRKKGSSVRLSFQNLCVVTFCMEALRVSTEEQLMNP